jgi:hypothetical protein
MPIAVGLQHVGSFQVSGWPYFHTATLTSSEQEFKFNFICSELTVWNAGGEDLKFYFTSGSTEAFLLPAGKKVTMKIKAGSVFALSEVGTNIRLLASMTTVSLARIGIIPTGSYYGPVPDADEDGIPDEFDAYKTFAGEYSGSNPAPVGDSDLWLEYDDGVGGVLIYDKNTETNNLPNTLYIPDNCQMTFEQEDIQPIMDNLNAYYIDSGGVQQEQTILDPDLDGVNILNRNVDQTVSITVERTTLGGETVSITVYFKVHFPCIAESTPAVGYELEGDDDAETYSYPSTPESTTMDPDDLGFGFYEET